MEPIIRIEHLTHTYSAGTPFQRSAVEDVSLDIMPGEFLGIIGHTGSGKSTLIQHLNGLLRPTQGRVLLNGKDIWAEPKKIRQVRFQVGLVFQYPEYQLFEETVYKDIAYGPGNMGLDRDEIDRRVRESAALVGLTEDQLEKSPFELSGGQKRRVAIAGVIAMEPKVLILDEPTAGLDPAGRDEILFKIKDMHERMDMTVILVSHSMEDIAKLADRILVMNHGRVEMFGPTDVIFRQGKRLSEIGLNVPQITRLMGGQADPFKGTQQMLQPVCQGDGRGGQGQQGRAQNQKDQPQNHKDRKINALLGDGEDPPVKDRITAGEEKVEDSGNHNENQNGLQPLDDKFGRHLRRQDTAQGKDRENPVAREVADGKGQDDIGENQQDLGSGVQSVDNGVARKVLAQGNIFQHARFPSSFSSRASSRYASSTV